MPQAIKRAAAGRDTLPTPALPGSGQGTAGGICPASQPGFLPAPLCLIVLWFIQKDSRKTRRCQEAEETLPATLWTDLVNK